ncbi:MAG: prephenate dehydrogenase [Oscillospiraceae bacterium]|nr:prephenate dehydrogenase [Oscillospiraceae bacterium]
MTIGIIGLGLIGGSMAKSIKAKTDHKVLGFDLNSEVISIAQMYGAIDGVLEDEKIQTCDLILIAIRPGAAISWVENHANLLSKETVIVDLCGVKRIVVNAIAPLAKQHGFRYIGGHPMAGKEVAGFTNSSAHLYEGASMILTPDDSTDLPLLEKLRDFFYSIGFSKLTFCSPEEHDRIIAYTSQLAHVTSSAYIRSPESQQQFGFSAGSFRDMTRVAKLDENMWTELFLDNDDYLLAQVDLLIENLKKFQGALKHKDPELLRSLLQEGREMKEKAGGM